MAYLEYQLVRSGARSRHRGGVRQVLQPDEFDPESTCGKVTIPSHQSQATVGAPPSQSIAEGITASDGEPEIIQKHSGHNHPPAFNEITGDNLLDLLLPRGPAATLRYNGAPATDPDGDDLTYRFEILTVGNVIKRLSADEALLEIAPAPPGFVNAVYSGSPETGDTMLEISWTNPGGFLENGMLVPFPPGTGVTGYDFRYRGVAGCRRGHSPGSNPHTDDCGTPHIFHARARGLLRIR